MFEYLPNEIILLIYSYLELTELHQAFSSLNYRFERLLYDNFSRLYARLPSRFNIPLDKYSHQINNLCLVDWNPDDTLVLLQTSTLPRLHSLTIKSSTNIYFGPSINDLIHRILSLPDLYQCQIDFSSTLYIHDSNLPISKSIRRLKLSMITLDMLFSLLMHVPELGVLDVWLNSNGRRLNNQTYDEDFYCSNLKKLILGLHNDISFEEVLFLLRRMNVLKSLDMSGSVWDQQFLSDQRWRSILEGQNSLPLLNKIKIEILVRCSHNTPGIPALMGRFNQQLFRQLNFSITPAQGLWIHLKCLWAS